MNDEIKEILKTMKTFNGNLIVENTEVTTLCLTKKESKLLLDYITNLQQKVEQYEKPDDLTLFYMWLDEKAKDKMKKLQQENTIKDTNWESLKYYLEKLYYKNYIEEPIFDDIDKKIKELESKVEIKGYQKEIKHLQQENEQLRTEQNTYINTIKEVNKECNSLFNHLTKKDLDYKSRNEKAIEYIENELFNGKDDLEWCRRNDGTISGSDLPAYYILNLYDILKGDNND